MVAFTHDLPRLQAVTLTLVALGGPAAAAPAAAEALAPGKVLEGSQDGSGAPVPVMVVTLGAAVPPGATQVQLHDGQGASATP